LRLVRKRRVDGDTIPTALPRLLRRPLAQIDRIFKLNGLELNGLELNGVDDVTVGVVEAAAESVVIGTA
jgi:hypothetical protein